VISAGATAPLLDSDSGGGREIKPSATWLSSLGRVLNPLAWSSKNSEDGSSRKLPPVSESSEGSSASSTPLQTGFSGDRSRQNDSKPKKHKQHAKQQSPKPSSGRAKPALRIKVHYGSKSSAPTSRRSLKVKDGMKGSVAYSDEAQDDQQNASGQGESENEGDQDQNDQSQEDEESASDSFDDALLISVKDAYQPIGMEFTDANLLQG
jgi:hypothetical protein